MRAIAMGWCGLIIAGCGKGDPPMNGEGSFFSICCAKAANSDADFWLPGPRPGGCGGPREKGS